jgi:tagatose 6-phosphate kinase
MILCIGTTPALQRVMVFRRLAVDAVNRAVETLDGIAGKSVNVAKVLKELGEEPVALGFIGGDRGEELRQTLEQRGVKTDFIQVLERTRQCITVIDGSAGTQTELVEESKAVNAETYEALIAKIQRRVGGCKAMVLSGTLTPGAPTDFYLRCVRTAREHNVLTAVDAQAAALMKSLDGEPDLVKPNRAELGATLGRELREERDALKAAQELIERGAKNVVVTAGKAPTIACDTKQSWRISNPDIKAVNPIGSGDAFTAGVVSRLLKGEGLSEACRWGAACGAANAVNLMAGEVKEEDLKRLIKEVRAEKFTV